MVSLGDICQNMSYGLNASAAPDRKGARLLRITDIDDYQVNWKLVPGCAISKNDHEKKRLIENDILVARTGSIGLSCIIKSPPDAVYASYLIRLQIDTSKALPDYIAFFMRSEAYLRQLAVGMHGAAVPNINSATLSNIKIPLPSLGRQRGICDVVSSLLNEAKKAKRHAKKMKQDIIPLINSLIRESIRESNSFKIGDVLCEVRKGIGDTWKDYRVLGATRNGLALAKEPPGKKPERYKPVTPGTVFYNPMRIMIGSIAFADTHDELGITSPDYVVLRGKDGVVDTRWFYYWLRSPIGERCIQSLSRGAVRERMLFNRLAEGKIELPDYETQLKASKALAEIKPMQDAIDAQLKELELIPQKLVAQIFEN